MHRSAPRFDFIIHTDWHHTLRTQVTFRQALLTARRLALRTGCTARLERVRER